MPRETRRPPTAPSGSLTCGPRETRRRAAPRCTSRSRRACSTPRGCSGSSARAPGVAGPARVKSNARDQEWSSNPQRICQERTEPPYSKLGAFRLDAYDSPCAEFPRPLFARTKICSRIQLCIDSLADCSCSDLTGSKVQGFERHRLTDSHCSGRN